MKLLPLIKELIQEEIQLLKEQESNPPEITDYDDICDWLDALEAGWPFNENDVSWEEMYSSFMQKCENPTVLDTTVFAGICDCFKDNCVDYPEYCCEKCANPDIDPQDNCYQYCDCCPESQPDPDKEPTKDRLQKLEEIQLLKEQAEAMDISLEAYLYNSNCAGKTLIQPAAGDSDLYKIGALITIYEELGESFNTPLTNFIYKEDYNPPGLAMGDEEFMSNLVYNTEDMINQNYCFSNENMVVSDVNFGSDSLTFTANGEQVTQESGGQVFKKMSQHLYLSFMHEFVSGVDGCMYTDDDCEWIIHEDGDNSIKTMDNIPPPFLNWGAAVDWLNNNIYIGSGDNWVLGFPLGTSVTPSQYQSWLGTLNNLQPLNSLVTTGGTLCTGCANPEPVIQGCTNFLADNFLPEANEDDGTCCSDTIESLPSCMGGDFPHDPDIPDVFHTVDDPPIDDKPKDPAIARMQKLAGIEPEEESDEEEETEKRG